MGYLYSGGGNRTAGGGTRKGRDKTRQCLVDTPAFSVDPNYSYLYYEGMNMSIVEIPKGRYYGVADAAEEIGITVGRVRQMIRWGEMEAIRISERVWIIAEREVEKHKKSRSG